MSSAPKPSCEGFDTSFASRIAPAQVPKAGLVRTNSRSFSRKPPCSRNFRKVDDSPPGITSASTESSSSGLRTRRTVAPRRSSMRRCASKSPCNARTPMSMGNSGVLPAALLQHVGFSDRSDSKAFHCADQVRAHFEQHLRVVEMCGRFHDRASASFRNLGLREFAGALHKDSGANEDRFCAKLADERSVCRSCDPTRREIRDGEIARLRDHAHDLEWRVQILSARVEFVFAEDSQPFHLLHDRAQVFNCVDDVAGAGFAFGADHGGAFRDATQLLAEIARAANERNGERVLVYVMGFVSRRE